MHGAAANPEARSGSGVLFPFPTSPPGTGGVNGHWDAAVGHGCTSTQGAEQNSGSTGSTDRPGGLFLFTQSLVTQLV